MGKVVSYCRFSPRPDPNDTMTLEVQEQACRRYANMRGLTISEVLRDPEVSAYKTKLADREQGGRLVQMCRSGEVTDVLVARLDRIFRRVSDGSTVSDEWRELGVSLHLADEGGVSLSTGTAIGEVMFNVMLAFNQFTPHLTSERTSMAMKHMAATGKRVGRFAQYGWSLVDGKMVECEDEQRVIRHLATVKDVPPEDIAKALNSIQCKYRGRSWKTADVVSVLSRLQ